MNWAYNCWIQYGFIVEFKCMRIGIPFCLVVEKVTRSITVIRIGPAFEMCTLQIFHTKNLNKVLKVTGDHDGNLIEIDITVSSANFDYNADDN